MPASKEGRRAALYDPLNINEWTMREREREREKIAERGKGASIYDVRVKNAPNLLTNSTYIVRTEGGQKIQPFCGRYIWNPPKLRERGRNCGLPWGYNGAVPQLLIACAAVSKLEFVKGLPTFEIENDKALFSIEGQITYPILCKSLLKKNHF